MGSENSKTYAQNVPASIEIEDGVRISTWCSGNSLYELGPDDPKTSYEAFLLGQELSRDGPFLGTRNKTSGEFEWVTHSVVSEMADAFGSGLLIECNLRPSNDINVGLFAQNRMEWLIADQALARFSMVPVPLYNTLGNEAMEHIVNQANLSVMICDTIERARQVIKMDLRSVRHIVLMDCLPEGGCAELDTSVTLHSFDDIVASGRSQPQKLCPAAPDDVCTICYTSGTTGVPKGAVLTHRGLLTSVTAANLLLKRDNVDVKTDDVVLSYLPMAHIYERVSMVLALTNGARIGYFGGDITKLLDDIQALKPTLFTAVPRVLYKVYDRIHTEAGKSVIKSKILSWATESKLEELKLGQLRSDTTWDTLVFKKIREIFGGRVRIMTTGGAPISANVLNFFRIALSCAVVNGYGQTETAGVTSATFPFDFRGDHAGGPLPCIQVKLTEVPELGYFKGCGAGQVCVKGPTTFREYYKMPEQTAETIDKDGWVQTGDIGRWTQQGTLQIVDRCKQIFKLSQGEYIAPEKVEGALQRCPHLAQVFVDGLSDKDYLVAIVVPDFDMLAHTLGEKIGDLDQEKLCMDKEIRKMILEEIQVTGRQAGLKGFELAKRVHLTHEPFTTENGLLTATMKSKRSELRKRFASEVKDLYEESEPL